MENKLDKTSSSKETEIIQWPPKELEPAKYLHTDIVVLSIHPLQLEFYIVHLECNKRKRKP